MPLMKILKADRDTVLQMNVVQIVSNAGDGELRDGSPGQKELREFLRQVSLSALRSYADTCFVNKKFPYKAEVLQDIVNELGWRLEYRVNYGRYHGVPNQVGNDGLWTDPNGHSVVVEVKTAADFTISLDTIADYRDRLLDRGDLKRPCSMLLVVGQSDTNTRELEAQVRGSRHAWDTRIISVDSLFNLVRIKESTDNPETAAKIRRLLTPLEYTRLDSLVDVVFTTAQDVEMSVAVEGSEQQEATTSPRATGSGSKFDFTPTEIVEEVRERVLNAVAQANKVNYVKKSRTFFWDSTGTDRIVCTVSKRYTDKGNMKYWYAYHPHWSQFLQEGTKGYFVLSCTDMSVAFVIPEKKMRVHLSDFDTTEKKAGGVYYHIKVFQDATGSYWLGLPRAKGTNELALLPYQLSLEAPTGERGARKRNASPRKR